MSVPFQWRLRTSPVTGTLWGDLPARALEVRGLSVIGPNSPRMSDNDGERRSLRMPEEGEVFAVVLDMLGANRVKVRCADGVERTARIPGRMQKRIWIREDDVVLVDPWDWQDEKADITWRYEKQEADQLREEGHIN